MLLVFPFLRLQGGQHKISCISFKRSLHGKYEPFHRVSKIFQPIQAAKKSSGKDDEVSSRSFELLTAAGYVRQSSRGVFHILPLCQRVLDKMARAVHRQMAAVGAGQLTMPTLVRHSLWQQTGRAEKMGGELMTVEDRSGRRFVLSPTHEEAVTQLVGSISPVSSRHLPLRLYQITPKFRDEKRARFGLLRCKEFLMKDLYTFDASEAAARDTYEEVGEAYRTLLQELGIPAVRVRGDSGVMGGGLSHEFHVLAPIGEDRVLVRPDCRQPNCPAAVNLEVLREQRETAPGSAGADTCQACGHPLQERTGIEVGHTFLLGPLYSDTFGACCTLPDGSRSALHMGCYGLGLTRLLAAVVEARADEGGALSWPHQLAPFKLCVVTPKLGSREESAADWALRALPLLAAQPALLDDVLLDDRDQLTIGQRVREARRAGCPAVLVFGQEAAAERRPPRAELLHGDQRCLLRDEDLLGHVLSLYATS